jgi:hypothetical protein
MFSVLIFIRFRLKPVEEAGKAEKRGDGEDARAAGRDLLSRKREELSFSLKSSFAGRALVGATHGNSWHLFR